MSILSDTAIHEAMACGAIVVRPLREGAVGSNSVDVHLGRVLLAYENAVLDPKVEQPVRRIEIPAEGYLIEPGRLFLGVTAEYTETHEYVPWIDGRSSVGRLGLGVHVTAGRGDVGFCGHFTLEISTLAHGPGMPSGVRVYAGMKIAQITYFAVEGAVAQAYDRKVSAKYAGAESADPEPQPSRIWRDFTTASSSTVTTVTTTFGSTRVEHPAGSTIRSTGDGRYLTVTYPPRSCKPLRMMVADVPKTLHLLSHDAVSGQCLYCAHEIVAGDAWTYAEAIHETSKCRCVASLVVVDGICYPAKCTVCKSVAIAVSGRSWHCSEQFGPCTYG